MQCLFLLHQLLVGLIINEIKKVDCKTIKQLAWTGKFQPSGDVDRLYIPRLQIVGGH